MANEDRSSHVAVSHKRGTVLPVLLFGLLAPAHAQTVTPVLPAQFKSRLAPQLTHSHRDSLQQGDNVLDFAAWDASQFGTGTFVVASDVCHISKREGPDTIVAIPSSDASPVQTDSDIYIVKRESNGWSAYPTTIYRNTTSELVHFARCFLWSVRRTGPDSTRAPYSNIPWACTGGWPTGTIAPGDALMVRVYLHSHDQPGIQQPLPPEWLIGHMRIELRLCREALADSDYCDVLPQLERESNAFELRF